MSKRVNWTKQEDQILVSFMKKSGQDFEQFNRWSKIAEEIKENHQTWDRNGRQIRQRWINYLKNCQNNHQYVNDVDVQKFLNLIKKYDTKWRIISQNLHNVTPLYLKNFFYSSLKKGIRNLNLYLKQKKNQKGYKNIEDKFLVKLLKMFKQNQKAQLWITDVSTHELAFEIRQELVRASLKQNEPNLYQTHEFYQGLNKKIKRFSLECKLKRPSQQTHSKNQQKFDKIHIKLKTRQNKKTLQNQYREVRNKENGETEIDKTVDWKIKNENSQQIYTTKLMDFMNDVQQFEDDFDHFQNQLKGMIKYQDSNVVELQEICQLQNGCKQRRGIFSEMDQIQGLFF